MVRLRLKYVIPHCSPLNLNKSDSVTKLTTVLTHDEPYFHVTPGRIEKDLLQRIITCYMANDDYPEDLELELIHALDN